MGKPNRIFEKNYENYLQQMKDVDLSRCAAVLDITVDAEKKIAEIPLFNMTYRVSPFGVVNERGIRPDYGICVIILKHLLMCPQWVPAAKDWITYRDFPQMENGYSGAISASLRRLAKRGLLECRPVMEYQENVKLEYRKKLT